MASKRLLICVCRNAGDKCHLCLKFKGKHKPDVVYNHPRWPARRTPNLTRESIE